MVNVTKRRKLSNSNNSLAGKKVLFAAAAGAILCGGLTVKADISGFSGFAAPNTGGAYPGVGVTNPTTLQLLTLGQAEKVSIWNPIQQDITAFTASYNYQVTPSTTDPNARLMADGGLLAFQNGPSGTTTLLGGGGGDMGYNNNGVTTQTAAIGYNLWGGVYNYPGIATSWLGSTQTKAANTGPDLSLSHNMLVRVSYAGGTMTELTYDLTTGGSAKAVFRNVNLAGQLGSSKALVGFTGGSGGYQSGQVVSNFQMTSASTFVPLNITGGFTQKLVLPASAAGTTGASAFTTASIDGGTTNKNNNTFYEIGFNNTNAASLLTGLPASGSVFTSQNDGAHQFQMQNYANNSAVLLNNVAGNSTGTLTLGTPQAYKTLSLLEMSGNGPNFFSMTVNYSNGAPATTIQHLDARDWFNQQDTVAWNASGRAVPSATGATTFNNVGSANPSLYQLDVPLTDITDPIASLTFNYESGNGTTAIYAVSGAYDPKTFKYQGLDTTTPAQFDNGATLNFTDGTNKVQFTNGNTAIFDDTATGSHTVTVQSGGVVPNGVQFNNTTGTAAYVLNGTGTISGPTGLTVQGGGSVTLNNPNTYTGNTLVTNNSTLTLGASGTLATGKLNIDSGSTVNFLSGSSITGTATLVTDSGAVNVNGNLTIPKLAGAGTVTLVSPGGTLTLLSGGTFTGTLTGNGGSLALAGTGGTFSGVIGDGTAPSKMVVNSTGTWTIGGASNYSGGTTVTAGVAKAAVDTAFGTGPINMNGGSLASTTLVHLANQITGSGLNIASGSNTVEITNTGNTYTGSTNVQGGTLILDNAGGLGGSTNVVVSSGASFVPNYSSANAGVGITTTISGMGANSQFGGQTVDGPAGAFHGPDSSGSSLTWAGNIVISGTTAIQSGLDSTLILTGSISGSTSVQFSGSPGDQSGGTVILAPAAGQSNTYSGETAFKLDINANILPGATLKLGANNGISPNSGLNMIASANPQAGTVELNGFNQSLTYLTGGAPASGSLVLLTNSSGTTSTLTITSGLKNGAPTTFAAPISGNINLVMNDPTGLGKQILKGSNDYSGTTTILKGTLSAGSASAFSSSTVSIGGGTLGLAPSVTAGTPILTSNDFASMVTNRSDTQTDANAPVSISGGTLQLLHQRNAANTADLLGVGNSAFFPNAVAVHDSTGFTAKFTYSVPNGYADGMTFILQNDPRGASAVGGSQGGKLAYGGATTPIVNSAGIAIEVYPFGAQDFGTAFVKGGLVPGDTGATQGTYQRTTPVDIVINNDTSNGAFFDVQPVDITLSYDGPNKALTETIFGETSQTTFSTTYTGVDYSALLGGPANGDATGFVGFTAADGGVSSNMLISNFSFAQNVSSPQSIPNAVVSVPNTTSGIEIGASAAQANSSASIGALTVSAGSTINVTVPTGANALGVLVLPSGLTIAQTGGAFTGKLDMGKNGLDIPTSAGLSLAQVTAMVKSGLGTSATYWSGTGIASAAAAADTNHLTALGVIVNDKAGAKLYGSGGSIANNFDGADVGLDDILVKYTYYGDADLNGVVNGTDYQQIDFAFTHPNTLTGWVNGDFNYDGKIDGSDYALIDNTFNRQGASLATAGGASASSMVATASAELAPAPVAVPEPTSLGLVALGSVALLSKRRRRN